VAKGNAQIEISASSNRLAAGLATAHSKFRAFATSVASGMSRQFSKIKLGDIGKTAIGTFAGGLFTRGMDAMVDSAHEVVDFERSLMRLGIATDATNEKIDEMRTTFRGISRATGINSSEVLRGASAYVGFTGDAAGAADAAQLFADVAAATGASTSDVAQAMAALKTSMNITAKEGEAAFSALIVQGKGGAVEIKDMASELAALAPQFAQFQAGKGLGGLREMGAAFQVIMNNSATASDAATKFRALMSSLADPRTVKELNKIGVQVFDNNGRLKNASTIFKTLAANQKLGDPQRMAKIFGREEARAAVRAIRNNITAYGELRAAAEDTGAVQRDKMRYLESTPGKLDKAFNTLKETIADVFTPERIQKFARAVSLMTDGIVKAMQYVEKAMNWEKYGRFSTTEELIGERAGEYTKFSLDDAQMASGGRETNDFSSPAWKFRTTKQASLRRSAAYWRAQAAKVKDEVQRGSMIRAAENLEGEAGAIEKRSDVWLNKGSRFITTVGPSTITDANPKMQAKLRNIDDGVQVQMLQRALATAITDAIKRGFESANTVSLKIGDEQIARANDRSTDVRRRPHP
jgi:TP901 family phage tail tape measure protein